MPSRPTTLVHTDEGDLEESNASARENRSSERPLSSAVERRVHIADVVGSIPTVATTSTTWVGDVCEIIAAGQLMALGYGVSRPLSNGLPYDLIADDGRRLLRIQVKSAVLRNGAVYGRMSTSKHHRGRSAVDYAGRVDWMLIVWREAGRCYVVRPEEARTLVALRVEASRNNQSEGVRWAADYELAVALGPALARGLTK